MRKQLAVEPFQVVQKPSLVSFQVPSPLAPALPTGSRVILPSGVNTILNLTFDGVDDGERLTGEEGRLDVVRRKHRGKSRRDRGNDDHAGHE